jgi:hypothetical protein
VCSFGACIVPGEPCRGASDCAPDEFCDYFETTGADVCAGSTAPTGRCLPRPRDCTSGGVPGETCLDRCVHTPESFSFEPVVLYRWPEPFLESSTTSSSDPYDISMTPIVVQLDDDDCNGVVDARDLPDIVATTFRGGNFNGGGVVHALTVRDGRLEEKWHFAGVEPGYGQLAGGDLHPSMGGEVIACADDGTVVALSSTGELLWRSARLRCNMPALGDLDQDGSVEVVVEGGILDGATGALRHALPLRSSFALSDLDGDGRLDVVGAFQAFAADGSVLADTGSSISGEPGSDNQGMPAVVDLDLDGAPEVAVVVPNENELSLWHWSATAPGNYELIRAPFRSVVEGPPRCWGVTTGMGPITAGDFDGDGRPDLGFAGFLGYVVLSGAKLMDAARPSTLTDDGVLLWMLPTSEDNGSTGSAVFDFDGDGRVEILYNATDRLHIMNGSTGETLGSICNTTGSIYEFPVVADVDGDGEANVIIVANAYWRGTCAPTYQCEGTWQSGLRVLGSSDGSWVRAPRVWNQHTYHVTNVTEDGEIPRVEAPNWTVTGLNNFRQNRQPGAEYGAPDATVAITCATLTAVQVTVRNVGEALLATGVEVDVLDEAGATLGTVVTTRALGTAQSESLLLEVGASHLASSLRAVVREGSVPRDCRADNDSATLACLI